MAGESIVGALRVVLGMDTAEFEDGTKEAAKKLEKFNANLKKIGAAAGAAFVAAAIGVAVAVKGVIDEADKMGKVAQKFGVPVEQLSELAHAASLSDISLEQLGTALGKLSKNMIAAGKDTSEQAAAFEALGIKVKDGNNQLKSSDQILLEVADKFSKFQDGVTKTALAMAIFGKAGAELIPLLNQGADGIQKLREQAQKLGIVISSETAKAAEEFNDNLKTLGKTKDAIILKILASGGLLQAMAQLSARMVDAAANSDHLTKIGDNLGKTIQVLTALFDLFTVAVSSVLLPVNILIAAAVKIAQGDLAGALKAIVDEMAAVKTAGQKAAQSVRNLVTSFVDTDNTGDQVIDTMNKLKAAYDKLTPPPAFDPEKHKQMEKFNEELKKIEFNTKEAAGAFASSLAPGFLSTALGMELLKNQITVLSNGMVALGKDATKLNEEMAKLAAAKLTAEFLTPLQQYALEMQKLNLLVEKGKLGQEAYQRAAQQAALKVAEAYGQAAQSIVSPMADTFKTLASMNKKYAGAAKALAIAEALVNTYLAAVKALASGFPPFNYVAAAAVTAAGLANVAKIKATEFATGGSFKIGGGVGGIDNQMVTIKGTPGEMVDIRRPGQESFGVQEISLTGIRPKDFFSGDMLRDLFDGLNRGYADGYRLKVVT